MKVLVSAIEVKFVVGVCNGASRTSPPTNVDVRFGDRGRGVTFASLRKGGGTRSVTEGVRVTNGLCEQTVEAQTGRGGACSSLKSNRFFVDKR